LETYNCHRLLEYHYCGLFPISFSGEEYRRISWHTLQNSSVTNGRSHWRNRQFWYIPTRDGASRSRDSRTRTKKATQIGVWKQYILLRFFAKCFSSILVCLCSWSIVSFSRFIKDDSARTFVLHCCSACAWCMTDDTTHTASRHLAVVNNAAQVIVTVTIM